METIIIALKKLSGNADIALPCYMTEHAAGMDIVAAVREDVKIAPGERVLIPSGFSIALPPGYEAQIRPRSGLALRKGITLLNAPGTIDADYRGEIGIIVINHGQDQVIIQRGERIAQMVVQQVCRVVWHVSRELGETERNHGGFGHTGNK